LRPAVKLWIPGFNPACNILTPLHNFPSGQSLAVELVSNSASKIRVSAKTGAFLQEELTHFNSSGTPFYSKGFTKFSAYVFPSTIYVFGVPFDLYTCTKISCLVREDDYSIFYCDARVNSWHVSEHDCNEIEDVNVAGTWVSAFRFSYTTLGYVNWDILRECKECASKGKDYRCDHHNSTLIKCFDKPSPRNRNHARGRLKNTLVAHETNVGATSSSDRLHNTMEGQTYINFPITSGVELATLDTYPITVIGISGRILIKMEDKICPICLSNYEPKDIMKSLPECLHGFHSDCIDGWLYEKPPTCIPTQLTACRPETSQHAPPPSHLKQPLQARARQPPARAVVVQLSPSLASHPAAVGCHLTRATLGSLESLQLSFVRILP
ncbi:hypothetical protein V2J09_016713, partial [Rumex salicifolius]